MWLTRLSQVLPQQAVQTNESSPAGSAKCFLIEQKLQETWNLKYFSSIIKNGLLDIKVNTAFNYFCQWVNCTDGETNICIDLYLII